MSKNVSDQLVEILSEAANRLNNIPKNHVVDNTIESINTCNFY